MSARYYLDFTGCGNTLNMQSPRVPQLIMDSLRYWVLEMHVDGFRFDLAKYRDAMRAFWRGDDRGVVPTAERRTAPSAFTPKAKT